MKRPRDLCLVPWALLATTPSFVQAQEAPPPAKAAEAPAAQRVDITGGRESDTEQRRRATAAKIVIGRDEIDKFGDSTVGEVLRRLPGVTTPGAPGRGGPPRMRGLGNGYTQLLIDGQRTPPGFSLESLTPDQIERIEILRAPTAETGARAIAGTINIVTREGYRRRLNEVRLGFAYENGAWTPGGSWTHNDSAGALTYNLSASAFANRRRSQGLTETVDTSMLAPDAGSVVKDQTETSQTTEQRRGVNTTARLQWRLSETGDILVLSPSVFHSEGHSDRRFQLVQAVGSTPPPYAAADAVGDSGFTTARLNGSWRQRLGGGPRLELNGTVGGWRSFSDTLRQESDAAGTLSRTLHDSSRTRERSANLTTKLSQSLGGNDAEPDSAHSLVGGVEVEAVRRNETRVGDSQADDGGGDLQASSLRLAGYAQDEWNLTPNWAVHAGLRWEGITTRGDATDGDRPVNRSSVTTPLLHLLWKPDPKGRDQVRLSLTRSYRAPALATLLGGYTFNSKSDPAGPINDPTAPDRGGNPNLKPELARGIDLAIERYLAGGGVLSANVFHRSISNLMRSVTTEETVLYNGNPVQRYVARQQNIGSAVTQGVEIEAKFALDLLLATAPRVEMRGNVGLFRSRVDGVPGPDNRLDQQAKATANVGADYRFRGIPLTLGGNLNWVPGYETQLDDRQRTFTGGKGVFDAFALWTFDPTVALRLLASNLGARDYESSNTIVTTAVSETARSLGPSFTNWQLRLELKL